MLIAAPAPIRADQAAAVTSEELMDRLIARTLASKLDAVLNMRISGIFGLNDGKTSMPAKQIKTLADGNHVLNIPHKEGVKDIILMVKRGDVVEAYLTDRSSILLAAAIFDATGERVITNKQADEKYQAGWRCSSGKRWHFHPPVDSGPEANVVGGHKSPVEQRGEVKMREAKGFTLIELLMVVAIIAVVAAIAVPALLRARISGNEASAIGSLRTINSAQATYSSSCGRSGYAQSLDDLFKPPVGSQAGFISPDLATNGVVKSGYYVEVGPDASAASVTVASQACNAPAADAVGSYFAEAHPVSIGSTGQRSFGTDNRRTIYFMNDGLTIAPGMGGASVLQ